MMTFRRFLLWPAAFAAVCGLSTYGQPSPFDPIPASQLAASAPADDSPNGQAAEPLVFAPASEVVPRLLELEEQAERSRVELSRLQENQRGERRGDELAYQAAELRLRLDDLVGRRDIDGGAVARLRAVCQRLEMNQEEHLERVSARFRRVEDLETRWREAEQHWQAWGEHLRSVDSDPALAADIERALQLVRGIRDELEAALPPTREAQRQAQNLLRESRSVELEIERVLDDWATSLKRRSGAVLLTPEFFRELELAPPASLSGASLLGERGPRLPSFLDRNGLTILLQALVALFVALIARWLQAASGNDRTAPSRADRQPGPLSRPWALGLLAAVAGLGSWYEPAAGSWRLLPAVLLSLALVLLATVMYERRRVRGSIYLLAGLSLAFEVSQALVLPWAAARLSILGLAVVPLVLLVPMMVREHRQMGHITLFGLTLRGAVCLLVVEAVAETLGYHALAIWLFQAGLATAVLVFVATLFFRVCRPLASLLLRSRWLPTRPSWTALRPEIERRLSRAAQVVVVLLAGLFAADIWHLADSPAAAWRQILGWNASVGGLRITFGQVLLAAATLYAALALSWLLRSLLDDRLASRLDHERGMADSAKTLLRYSFGVFGVLAALSVLGLDLKSFAIVAGAFGVGIGFGLQNIVSNFVSGLILLFERPIRTGDVVGVAGGVGEVRRIGLRSTILQTLDRSEIIVPNSQLVAETVTNWTLSSPLTRLTLPVAVAYGSSMEKVQSLLLDIAGSHTEVLAEPAPTAPVIALGDSAVQLELRAFVAELDQRPRVTSDLARAVLERFAAEGISIPFPQRDVHLYQSES